MAEKVILDCDPGHDDAIAIVLAAGSPAIDPLAITTCAGNQTVEKVTRNALAVCEVAGISGVPVAAGASGPLVRDQIVAPDIHGESGLDGPTLPTSSRLADPRHAVHVIIGLLMDQEPGTVNLVPTGPLTNIALALRKEPRIVERVKQVVLMGGSFTRGNTTPTSEFNILADPEAAAVVFAAGWKVTMVGLDVTHQAVAGPDVIRRIAQIDSPLSRFLVDVLTFFGSAYRERQGFEAPPVHDPCCIAALIDPEIITTKSAFVAVELTGRWTYGMTVTDFGDAYGHPHNASVATELNSERFWDLTTAAIAALSRGTPHPSAIEPA